VRGRYGGYRLAPGYRMPPLMLADEEALAVLLGLIAGRKAGLVTTSAAAAESAAAKLHRVLPDTLGRRLDAVLQTAEFTAADPPMIAAPETGVLLLLAEAARDRRPVAIGYTASDGRHTDRTVHPYGIVAHSGRWYLTGADSASGQVRTFRLDRITSLESSGDTFEVPDGFDPAAQVLSGIAQTPYRHEVLLRVQGPAEQVQARFPAGIATLHNITDGDGWVRVQMRAERLDWVPGVLAGLGLPFVVERPDALRGLLRTLAGQLVAAASVDRSQDGEPSANAPIADSHLQ